MSSLDGDLLDERRKVVAEVDDLSFKDGHADQLVVAFDQILGLGGGMAALNYSAAKVVRDGDDLDFQLSANQAANFEAYKKTATN